MLSIFKSNNPAVVLVYIFCLILFRLCLLWLAVNDSTGFLHTEPLSASLFSFLKNLSQNQVLLSTFLSALLSFVQAILVNNIVNSNKMTARKNYAAGAVFIVFSSFFTSNLFMTPALLSLTFVLLAIGRLFSLVKKEKANGDIFDLGFFISIAALFYFPSIALVLFAYIGLAIVRSFNYREWLIVLTGFTAPLFVVFVFYFWNDITPSLLPDLMNQPGRDWLVLPVFTVSDKLMMSALAFCTIAGLFFLPGSLHSSLIQLRKFANILVVFTVFVLLAALLQQTVRLSHGILLAFPLSLFTSMMLLKIKRSWVAEVIYLILILLVLAGQYLPLFNII